MSLPGKKGRTGKGKFLWMYLVILSLITITTCFAYQGQTVTTVTPPPHRGAARQMYGSGSLRPPGTNPATGNSRQQLHRNYPSTPPPDKLNYPIHLQRFPVTIHAKDIPTIYKKYFPDLYRPIEPVPKFTRTQTRGGGRQEYSGLPRRFPMDGGFRHGMDELPDIMGGRFPERQVRYGTPKLDKMMRDPVEEWKGGDIDMDHQCGGDCDPEEFMCISSCTCIKNALRCDGDLDCANDEDELECGEIDTIRNVQCEDTEKYVRCPRSGKCILKVWLCDGDDDCGDFSDETQCGSQVNCTSDQFECANGLCIPKTWTCDNDNDCKDFSDEMNCTKIGCTEDEYTCTDGSCISLSWKCDRQQDCNDNSDEQDCDIEAPSCNDGEFQCAYQKCIKMEFRCDGDNDCDDWSDEDNCPKNTGTCGAGEYRCTNGRCIPESWKCDKQDDCESNEDEINCTKTAARSCSPDEYTCNSGACILKTWVCDGFSDCSGDEDESDCHITCDETKFACSGTNPNDTRTEFCINKKHVCDGQRDCPKGEDEIDCPTRHDCNATSKCSQVCITTADKKESCACHPGYNLSKDGYSCEDVNECLYETDPVCSQTCNNTIGSFICGCMTGYILRPDLRSCKALGAPPTLLFANRMDIRQVSLSNSKYTAILKGLHNAIALDYHYKKGLIFWSDVSMDVIRRAYVNGSGSTGAADVIKWGLESPGGVALDWIHDLIFWTDSGTRRVEVASIDGKQRAILVAKELDKPRAIVVHPGQAYVFWTDWGPNPKIERIEMDGSNRKSIITESVFWPNGLTLDYTNNRIYWADAKHNVIETSLYDGSDRRKVISKGLPHPFALTIFEDAIYWTDWHTKAISTANKATGAGFRTIHSNLHFPMDIHSYHPQRQPDYKNHCGNNSGGCEHLCLPNKKSFSCRCRMGLKLNHDGKTCMKPENLLIFARKKDLRIKHLGNNAGHNNDIVIPIDGIKSAVAITWDSRSDTIFWTDVEKDTISKVNWNGSNQEVIIKNNIASPAGLAYDWVTDKLYWTDAGTAKIEVAKSDGSIRSLLIWEGLDKPRDIVVDPTAGYMYWSDWGDIPKIERAAMDGTMRTMIVSQNLTWPNGLAIDYDSGRLYWTDGGTNSIEYSNLDGSNRRVLLSGLSLPHPFGLDVFGDEIYWTDWNSLNIERVNKNTGLDRQNVSTGISDLMDVRVFHRKRKYAEFKSECLINNGGCSHMCLLKPEGHTCACPVGIKIEPDGKSCKEGPLNSLILAHRVDIRRISLDVPYIVDVVLPFTQVKNVVSVDVDRKTGEIYWTDTSADVIQKNTADGKNPRLIIAHELEMADGIAICSTGRKMYWTDGRRNSIEVAELDGTNRKLLFWADLDTPRAITLHYHLGLMFWSDWGKNAKIEVAEMDGSNRKALITTKLTWPNGLAIDRPAERLYWNDGKLKTIESSDFKGNDRRVVMTDVPHPYGLVVVGNHIYWTDWHTESLHRAEKANGSDRVVIRDKLIGLMDVRSVQSDNIAENVCGEDNGGCSHLCLRNSESYSCACPTGISMRNGSRKICEHQPLNYILYTTKADLGRISLDTGDFWDVTLPVYKLDHVIDVDFHYEEQLIVYTDAGNKVIQSVNMRNLTEKRDIIKDDLITPNGISVDWISNIIYWTDEGRKVIECSKLDGTMRKTIAYTNTTGPRSIATFPRKGYIFWSVWGFRPCIERAFLDGSDRKIVVEKDLGFPNGLTVDFRARRIYWADAKWDRIETSDLNGNGRQLIHSSNSPKIRPFGLALMDDYIYWTDWYQKKISRADKTNGKSPTDIKSGLVGAMGITIVSESKQKGWNPCAENNGGCTHLCFFKLTNYTCGCPDQPTELPCKTEPKLWVSLIHPDGKDEYEDEDNEDSYPNNIDFDDMHTDHSHRGPSDRQLYIMILVPVSSFLLLGIILIIILVLFKTTRKKYLYATGRSVMTFSNPNYYTSNAEPTGSTTNVDKKPFLWKRLKYDKSQERVYEEKAGSSSPEVASLIPTVLTPSSSNCEAITPELERSPSITPLHRVNSLTPVA